ncbi:hypothetical protein EH31_15440 [Erythrobacter longus]|uniref:Glycosyl transferase family 51 domain-containing protein n=1 Tax=Erythrobacter longus TaxID=1044 RepID=A0A074MT57_ERYLO|nr:transglycosylase domain-containing protein [Erythrobacter longus]KEO88827.1 hypothetical protein EH31_15440 [Erythrobacter longus]
MKTFSCGSLTIVTVFAATLAASACSEPEPWLDKGMSEGEYNAWVQTIDAQASAKSLAASMARDNRLDEVDTPAFVEMIIAVEDPNFAQHNGFDTQTPGAGPTTLTQEVATRYDILVPAGESVAEYRKGWTRGIEETLSKEKIMAFYLSDLRYGSVESAFFSSPSSAAQTLFDKEISALTRDEMIVLVAGIHYRASWNPKAPLERTMLRRIARITALLDGKCQPENHADVLLLGCSEYDPEL